MVLAAAAPAGQIPVVSPSPPGDRCIYFASHNSGHFKTVIWQKGSGLVEYAMGGGARAEGFRLKRIDGKKR